MPLGERGEQLARLEAALAEAGELERRAQGRASRPLGLQMQRQPLAVILGEHRLGVERVHLAWAAVGEKLDDALRPRLEMRRARGKRIAAGFSSRGGKQVVAQQRGQAKSAKAAAAV